MEKGTNAAGLGNLCTIMGGILWGFSGTCGQYLFLNYGIDTSWLTTVRMISAGIVLIAVGFLKEKEHMIGIWKNKKDRISLVIFSILGLMFCQLAYMQAIFFSNAGTATILQYLGPVFIMIIACVSARKLPDKKEAVAICLALLGTFILATHGNVRSMVLTGQGLLWGILAALGLTLYTMIPTDIMKRWGSITVTGYGMLIGGVVLGIAGQVWNKTAVLDGRGITAVVAISLLGTVLAFTLYLQGVKEIGAVKASMLASVEPVSATIFMVLWLDSEFIWIDGIGFLCILVTVFLLSKREESVS